MPCPFRLITGWDCPFCGGSRALGDLLRGDLPAAFGHNAYALVVLLPVAAAVAAGMRRQELGAAERWWPSGQLGRACSLALLTATAAWCAVRNLPGFAVLRA